MYEAIVGPNARHASVAYRKCQPSLTRVFAHSAAAAWKLTNVRVGILAGAVVVSIVNDTPSGVPASQPTVPWHRRATADLEVG